ncbi:unnamed protein product [Lactuca virosa]|uniref:Uncharacterized protein n=1 Tax=Lactuca virosa TaxID=75947 RepID=A0AAU9MAQ3_9ASTR|nr:unnamed protein product [Lactuca virosa]
MSSNNKASGSNPIGSFSLMNLCGRVIFDGSNFMDWIRNIRMVTRYEDKEYVLDKELKELDESTATPEEVAEYQAHERDATKVACIMMATMTAELQKSYEDYYPFEMHQDLMERYHQSARQERYEIISSMITTRMKDSEPITSHMQKMQRYVDRLMKLNVNFPEELAIDIILHSLPSCYDKFRMTYHMNKEEVTLSKLQGLLKTAESGLKSKSVATPTPTTTPVWLSGKAKGRRGSTLRRVPRESPLKAPHLEPKEVLSLLLPSLRMLNASTVKIRGTGSETAQSCGIHICCDLQGLRRSEDVEHRKINLIMGNKKVAPVTKIGVYTLLLDSGLKLDLNKCVYSSEMVRNIISFHALYKQGFTFSFDNEVGSMNAFFNNILYFKALPCNGVYEAVSVVDNLGNNVLCIDSSTSLDKASLWHVVLDM